MCWAGLNGCARAAACCLQLPLCAACNGHGLRAAESAPLAMQPQLVAVMRCMQADLQNSPPPGNIAQDPASVYRCGPPACSLHAHCLLEGVAQDMHTHTHTRSQTRTHTRNHEHTLTHTHTRVHTHTHALRSWWCETFFIGRSRWVNVHVHHGKGAWVDEQATTHGGGCLAF